ncbi:MAG TPA: hypothetical protein VHL77_02885 [Ferruginibacter sp.]|nr:hypothetical protein [Ferruginibacter sp.]
MKTKNIIPAILVSLGILSSAASSAQSFEKGSVTFSAGVGVGAEYNSNYYNSAFGTKAVVEAGMWQAGPGVISLGAEAGGTFSNGGSLNNYRARTIVVGGRAAWHYGWNINGLDTYAGLSTGAGFNQYRYETETVVKQNEVIPVFGAFVGASYFFTPTLGVNIEAGRDITQVQAGIIFKIK